ncbi:hypothetical protein Dcar01_03562 [Deinococcus carri]|uniref:Uncharacterized protein n=1 Tax=Deinococcus carri TaxID=1211323 RepID=A0ABP9WBU8_9DEIO
MTALTLLPLLVPTVLLLVGLAVWRRIRQERQQAARQGLAASSVYHTRHYARRGGR